MVKENVQVESLEALAKRITHCANEADERTIEVAMLVREARERVNLGEAGNIKWHKWAENNIGLSKTRIWELQRVAAAEDPNEELERLREAARKRVEAFRQRERAARAVALRGSAAKTARAPEASKDDPHSPVESGSEQKEGHPEAPKDEPPLRNGGQIDDIETAVGQGYRIRLIEWARAAPIEQIKAAWEYVQGLDASEATSRGDRTETAFPAEPDKQRHVLPSV